MQNRFLIWAPVTCNWAGGQRKRQQEDAQKKSHYAKVGLAARLKSGFISTVSHELMTPLSVIKEAVSLLLEGLGGELTEKQQHFLNMARQNVERAVDLIYDLRAISRSELERPDLRRKETDLRLLVARSVEEIKTRASRMRIKIRDRSPKKLVYVLCDEGRISKVVKILMDEALRFCHAGDSVTVKLTTEVGFARVNSRHRSA